MVHRTCTTQALKRKNYSRRLKNSLKATRQTHPRYSPRLLMSSTRTPSDFVIPPPEVVEITTRNVSDFARDAPGELKGKITMIENLSCYRVPEIAPKHTTRSPGPGTHAGTAHGRLVRRRRAAASSLGGSGDVKFDACERDVWWSLERCQCGRRGA